MKERIIACEDRGKVPVIGDMNARMGGREMEGVVGKFGVSRMNENGIKLNRARKRNWVWEIHFLRKRIS